MCAISSKRKCSTRSFRATSGWVKRQAMGFPASCTTPNPAVRQPTLPWPKRCSRGTLPEEKDAIMLERRPALGKGLSALIPDAPEPVRPGALEVDVDPLAPNQHQPRLQMDEGKLDELAASIKANGVIQPILVRRAGDRYHIIAGERRWRAAQRAGLHKVPVVVREIADGDKQLLELALIENLQREGLNPIDEALAYQRLATEFSLTQDQIAAAVGKDRSSVANFIRLLKLPDEVRGAVPSRG